MWDRINKFVYLRVVISACVLCVIFYLISIALSFPFENMALSVVLTASVLIQLVLSSIAIWLMRKMQVFNINDFGFGKMRKSTFLTCVGAVIAVIGFLFVFIMFPENRFIAPNPLDYAVAALSQVIGVGIYEEVFFRGLVLKILLKKMGHSKRGIINVCIISSAIFGMVHVTNIVGVARNVEYLSVAAVLPVISQIIFATAFGVLAAALFLRSGTLWIPILLHGVGNLVAQTFVSFISRGSIMQLFQTSAEMSIAEFITSTLMSAIPLLVAGLLLLKKVPSSYQDI